MAKTVVVEKEGIKKTVPEEYKKDFIVAGWKEVAATAKSNAVPTYTYPVK